MKRSVSILAVLCCCVGMFTSGGAAKTYKMAAFPIPLMVVDNQQGVFIDLFREVAKRTGENFELEVYPTNRVLKLFQDGHIDGFFPGLDIMTGDQAAKSDIFYNKTDFAFVKQGTPVFEKISQFEGKTIGLTTGYPYSAELLNDPKITLEYAENDVINMRKLSKGRIDAFIVEEKSGLKAREESGVTDVVYDPQKPLYAIRVFFAFQGTDEGWALAKKFSSALEKMKQDGTFEKIMSKAQ
jgi:polar amino acid transport system substrate-binding protein